MKSDGHPGSGCQDLRFTAPLELLEGEQVALEDYARALTAAESAEVIVEAGLVSGVHVCRSRHSPAVLRDLEAFAKELGRRGERGGGLGWS